MIEILRETDRSLFHLINQQWTNHALDLVLPHFRADKFLLSCYMLIGVLIYEWYPKSFLKIIIAAGVCLLLTDQLASHVIKPLVHRIRPCANPIMEARLIVPYCGSGWSFVSSHAANVFGLAAFMITIARSKWINVLVFGIWVELVCYSQVYVGVHFPGDMVGGAILGVIIGAIVARFLKKFVPLN